MRLRYLLSLSLLLAAPSGAVTILSENFDAGLPAGWTVVDDAGSGVVWGVNGNANNEAGNYTGGSGTAASVSSGAFGPAEFDTTLWSPVLDLAAALSAELSYLANYQNFAFLDFFDVEYTTDGGATRNTLLSWNEDHGALGVTPGEAVALAIPTLDSLQIGFHYYDPNDNDFDRYAQVDDVVVDADLPAVGVPEPTAALVFLAGALVVGSRSRRIS